MPAMGIYEIVPQPEPRPELKAQTDKIQWSFHDAMEGASLA